MSTTSRSLLLEKHPLHSTFIAWVNKRGQEPSKRQAAKFLQKYPRYRQVEYTEAEQAEAA
jgi:hypothetical protein